MNDLNHALKAWISLGGACIDLLLESGLACPEDQLALRLTAWIGQCEDAGWHEVAALGKNLLDDRIDIEKKADDFLSLCMWYESMSTHMNAMVLQDTYFKGSP